MSEHTKEPWRVVGPNAPWEIARIFSGDRYIGNIGNSDETDEETRLNASRIVACVNACAGIPTKELGKSADTMMRLEAARANARAWQSEIAALRARAENAEAEAKRKEQYLEAINDLMWNTWAVKGRRFGHDEGARIMEIMEAWASEQALPDKEPK